MVESEVRKHLRQELNWVKKYGVAEMGYRCFFPSGNSFGCPTNELWYQKPRTKEFYQEMQVFLGNELLKLFAQKQCFVTRSKENHHNEYLAWLQHFKLANSVGIYKFSPERIDSFFFVYDPEKGQSIESLINNLSWLEKHVNDLVFKLNGCTKALADNSCFDLQIPKKISQQVFAEHQLSRLHLDNSLTIVMNGQTIILSRREIEVMSYLQTGYSNKYIAEILKMHERSVEKYLQKIKSKLAVGSKQDLIRIAHLPQLQNLYRGVAG